MKNKHLVLLFLLTLLIGLAVRRAPWRDAVFFQNHLLRADTSELQRIEISQPGQSELILSRSEASWLAEQKGRSAKVPDDMAQNILAELANLRSIRIIKTTSPDTLGFSGKDVIQLRIYPSNSATEYLGIGAETMENGQACTFVQLLKHQGIYLAERHLRSVFSKTLLDFRNAAVIRFDPSGVRDFSIYGQNLDSLSFQKDDSTGNWIAVQVNRSIPGDSVQQWLAKIARLRKLPFADLFDESHANKTFLAEIKLGLEKSDESLSMKIYGLDLSNLPEELPEGPLDKNQLAPYVLSFSQYPTNYFALSDTMLLRQICRPF